MNHTYVFRQVIICVCIVSGGRLIASSSVPGKIMLIKTEGRTHERALKFQFHFEETNNEYK